MRKTFLFLVLFFGLFIFNSTVYAQGKLQEWKELKDFHKIMSQTFHPSEEGNLEPIKTRSAEMTQSAKTLLASTPPASFNTDKVKDAVSRLASGSEKLDTDIKAGMSDKKIKKSLASLHDVFHEIIGLCSEIENQEHGHDHEHGEHGHEH